MNLIKLRKSINNIGMKIAFFLFIFIISTLIVNLIINNIIISKYFSEIENRIINAKTDKSEKIFQSQINALSSIVQNYALWDDVYNKMQEKNIDKEWFSTNYTNWLPKKLNIDLIIIANRDKEIIHQYGLFDNAIDILNDSRISQLFNESNYQENINLSGFIQYNNDLYLIGISPIFQTNTEGISQGVVILGKKVSPEFITEIQNMFGLDVFITYDNKLVSSEENIKNLKDNNFTITKNKNANIYELNDSQIIRSVPIVDISNNEIGKINVIQSKDTFISAQNLMQKSNLFAIIISSIMLFILGFKFKNIIVNPIKKLENEIIYNINNEKKGNEILEINSNIDPLTGVYNHKYFFESISSMVVNCNKKISLLFCDIDKFKLTNDTFGHEAGNFILVEIAKIMTSILNDKGMVFRYGGQEFVVILCEFGNEEAFIEAENIRKNVADNPILQEYAGYFPITLSIGIASYPNNGLDAESLISNAETAMYYSKQNGRNQCNIYTDNLHDFLDNCEVITRKELLIDSALSLAEAVDAKDHYTGKHSKMVAKYSILIAEKLNMGDEDKNKLRIGALLHDCGKIGIPDNIINKPEKLSDDEYNIIKTHPILGNNIIKHITNDEKIIHCIRSHHEKWDGKGYPDGLSGTSIHLFARIVCIADVYHSMASDRPYRKALPKEKVIQEFIRGKCTQFDPMLVDILLEIIYQL